MYIIDRFLVVVVAFLVIKFCQFVVIDFELVDDVFGMVS